MTKQDQRGGDGSTNIQAHVVNIGPSAEQVREIASNLWNENMSRLTAVARTVAEERASMLRDEILAELHNGRGNPQSFEQPEKQIALLEAQKGFAASGDADLRKALTHAVLALSKEPERSIGAIVLAEAIKILPLLTQRQLQTITTVFVLRFVQHVGVKSLTELLEFWERAAGKHRPVPTDTDYRHIEYCGCGKINQFMSMSVAANLRTTYPGLVSKGISNEELKAAFGAGPLPETGIMKCLNDPSKVQIAALNKEVLQQKWGNWTLAQRTASEALLTSSMLSEPEVEALVKQASGYGKYLIEEANTWLSVLDLTSVGFAVGHSSATVAVPDFAALSTWVS